MGTYDVVFIDDEEFLTEIFKHFVGRKYDTWRCTTFSDSTKAYKQIMDEGLSARVWIVDLMMPEMNGAQIAEAIRSRQNGNETLVIAYTAMERSEMLRHEELRSRMGLFDWIMNKRSMLPEILLQVQPLIEQPEPSV